MRRAAAVWVTCLAIGTAGGCVAGSEYQAVVAELDTAKKDLESLRVQQQDLAQQKIVLEKLNAQMERKVQVASAAVQEAKSRDEAQRKSIDEQLDRLVQKLNYLVGQQKSLRRAVQDAKEDTVTLKELAELYQKKLRESSETIAAASPPPVMLPPEPASPVPSSPAQVEPTPTPPMEQPAQQAKMPPVAQQPPERKASHAVDEGWLSAIKRWVISLWDQVFS